MNYKKLALALSIVSAASLIKQNKKLKLSHFNLPFKNLPKNFHNFKIAHISDIHSAKIGISDLIFIKKLKNEHPDIIVITGDMLDSYKNDMDCVYNILSQISEIAPTYFVSGNHELRLPDEYEKLKTILAKLGIVNLNNSNVFLTKENENINLAGVEDYNFFKKSLDHRNSFNTKLNNLHSNDKFNILLSHRPEKIKNYVLTGFNLVLSGHAHGGQWQIPFIGGVFSPSQGFFPKYSKGIYKENNTTLVVSCGLGNSSFPLRINNQIELVIITLKKF
ncbi:MULTISPECIES: metallophosphoesterase [Gemella]|uniref:metallophosphoesterase n=1 Tax=Gemella TaxID=1378 RepID=UPI000768072B|nr:MULTISPECIES: metallophosphoesterase [Gemella]AME09094.1 phosphoesterase [Gemella sp. oral taxon 928]AXI26666.1 metallophosphoesterase [Gemella sp. ND 6198]